NAVLQLLGHRGVWAWKNDTKGTWDAARKRYRPSHGLRGVSDILGIMEGGVLIACEVKTGAAKLTAEQETFLDGVNRFGGLGLCVRDLTELDNALLEWRAKRVEDS